MHRLKRIQIKNFRSCKDVDLHLNAYTPLVGYNNAGKSNIIQAIIWLLAPTGGMCCDDFCGNDTSKPVEVTGELHDITDEILNKLQEKHREKIKKYISEGGVLVIKRVQATEGTTKAHRPLFVFKPGENVEDDDSWDKNPTGIDNAIAALFPEPIHIAAMQDASQDAAKNTASSTLGKLLKAVLGTVQDNHGKEIADAVANLEALLSADGDNRAPELTEIDKAANSALNDFFPGIKVRTEIPAPSVPTLFKSGTLKINDPLRSEQSWYNFESLGHGAQRTIQMALVRCMAERDQKDDDPSCRLLLIDEPELYLHPQAIEQIRLALLALTEKNYQVVFSTHSPMLIGRDRAPYTRLIRKDEHGTKVLPTMEEAAKQTIDDNRAQAETLFSLSNSSQILFSEKVLLVEGSTEARLLPFVYEKKFGRTLGADKIALVPLGGSGSTKKAIDILDTMGVKHQSVVDLDALFTQGVAYKVVTATDADITACKKHFLQRSLREEIDLNDNGLPEKNRNKTEKILAADAYAECAVSSECHDKVESLHKRVRDDYDMWAWPVGDIERVLDLTGKGEKHWVKFMAAVEEDGLEAQIIEQNVFDAFLDWIKPGS